MASERWTILKILQWTEQYFRKQGIEAPKLDAEVLLCATLKCERIKLYVNFDQPLTAEELALYHEYVVRRARWEPLSYILGAREFMGENFTVTPAVLIPRPETELLVEKVALLAKGRSKVRILDIGTGSGAIIISLLRALPEAEGVGVDISLEALKVASVNAQSLGVAQRVHLLQSDLFSKVPRTERFDLIVSNPPYIPTSVIANLAQDVRKEPKVALDGGRDGLTFYRRICGAAGNFLSPKGLIAMEIGAGQGAQVAMYLKEQGLSVVRIFKDYADLERMVFATRKDSDYADALLALR